MHALCFCIHNRYVLEFDYGGRHRAVAPYCHGASPRGRKMLRAVQLRGESQSGGLGFGKLWSVDQIENPRVTLEHFEPDDPDYNPDDSAFESIHCRIVLRDEEKPRGRSDPHPR